MKKAVVVDLDGTLLQTNTFKEYIYYTSLWALQCLRIDICVSCILFVLMRKLRLISHSVMKKLILRKTEFFMNPPRIEYFAKIISSKINENVLSVLKLYRKNGYYVCLSTAAPALYAKVIKQRYGLNGLCATPAYSSDEEWKENIRKTKCGNTLKYLKENDATLAIFLTDHYDDLELLKIPKERNILVNPSRKTLKILNENKVTFEQL